MKEVKFTYSLSIENKDLPALLRTLRIKKYSLESIEMEYSKCHDGIRRHFGWIRVTFSFVTFEIIIPLTMFQLGTTFQRELIYNQYGN